MENTKVLQEQYIDTDVLVIGAGAGGLTAGPGVFIAAMTISFVISPVFTNRL